MPTTPSFSSFMEQERAKQQKKYEKQAKAAVDIGDPPPTAPSVPTSLHTNSSSFSSFMENVRRDEVKAQRDQTANQGATGMGDFRRLEAQTNTAPPSFEPVPIPEATTTVRQTTSTPQFKASAEVGPDLSNFDKARIRGSENFTNTMNPAIAQSYQKQGQDTVADMQAQGQKLVDTQKKRLAEVLNDPSELARSIKRNSIDTRELASLPADQIPWDELAKGANFADYLQQAAPFGMALPRQEIQPFSDGLWRQIGELGKTDPVAAKARLMEKMTERDNAFGSGFTQQFQEGAKNAVSFGAYRPAALPQGGEEVFGSIAGSVVGSLPATVVAGGMAGAAAGNAAKTAGFGRVGQVLASGAATGATLETARQAAQGLARPDEFDAGRAVKEIFASAGNYAAYGGVYEGLGAIGGAVTSRLPQAVQGGLAKVGESLPGKIAGGTAQGVIAGGVVGVGNAVASALANPEGRTAKEFVRNVLAEAKQEASEELVEAVAFGITHKFVPMESHAVLATADTLKATTPSPNVTDPAPATLTPTPQVAAPTVAPDTLTPQVDAAPAVQPKRTRKGAVIAPEQAIGATTPTVTPLGEAIGATTRKGKKAQAPVALDRAALVREANPTMDEGAIQQVVRDTASMPDAEFPAFAQRVGKPDVTPAPMTTTATTATEGVTTPGERVFWTVNGERRTGTVARVNTVDQLAFVDVDGQKPHPGNRAMVGFGDLGRLTDTATSTTAVGTMTTPAPAVQPAAQTPSVNTHSTNDSGIGPAMTNLANSVDAALTSAAQKHGVTLSPQGKADVMAAVSGILKDATNVSDTFTTDKPVNAWNALLQEPVMRAAGQKGNLVLEDVLSQTLPDVQRVIAAGTTTPQVTVTPTVKASKKSVVNAPAAPIGSTTSAKATHTKATTATATSATETTAAADTSPQQTTDTPAKVDKNGLPVGVKFKVERKYGNASGRRFAVVNITTPDGKVYRTDVLTKEPRDLAEETRAVEIYKKALEMARKGDVFHIGTNTATKTDSPVNTPDAPIGSTRQPRNKAFAGERPQTTTAPANTPMEAINRREIVKYLNDTFAPLKTGTKGKGVLGLFNPKTGVIRTKTAEDFPIQLHEVGHKVDAELGLADPAYHGELVTLGTPTAGDTKNQTYVREEGVGEFVRLYVMNPQEAQQKAPSYYAAFEQKMLAEPKVHAELLAVRDMVARWNSQSPKERVLGAMSIGEGKSSSPVTKDWLYAKVIDELRPMQVIEKELSGGKELPIEQSPFHQAWLARGWSGKSETFLEHGVVDENFNKVGEPLKDILNAAPNLDDLRAYVAAKRAIEKLGQGFAIEQTLGPGISEADARSTIAELEGKYDPLQKRIVKYQSAVLDELVKSGRYSTKDVEAMRKMNEDYVPFYRLMDDNLGSTFFASSKRFANLPDAVRKFKGSGRTIIDPLESVVKNTYTFLNLATRQKVMNSLIDLAETAGPRASRFMTKVSTPMRPVTFELGRVKSALEANGVDTQNLDLDGIATLFTPSGNLGKNQIAVVRNGDKQVWEVNPDVYRAVMGMDDTSSNLFVKLLAPGARLLRAGATLSPDFAARNPISDQWTATVNSQYGYVPGVDWFKGLFTAIGKPDMYWKWKAGGGDQATQVSMDRSSLQGELNKLLRNRDTSLKGKTLTVLRNVNPIEVLRTLSNYGEIATRLGEFQKGVAKEGDNTAGIMTASLASRDVTVDFARKGSSTSALDATVAFLRSNVQALDKTVRVFKENPVGSTLKATAMFTLPTIALYFLNRDNPWWQEKPEWAKDTFWFVPVNAPGLSAAKPEWFDGQGNPKHFIYIPKKHLLAMTFGALPERILRWVDKHDPQAFKGFAKSYADSAVPTSSSTYFMPVPTMFLPALEVNMNHDTYTDAPIVPQRELRFLPKDRYGASNSQVAKGVGSVLGVSPRNVDHLVSGYGGGLGTYGTQIIDQGLGAIGAAKIPPKPDKGIASFPVAKSFLRDFGGAGSGSSVDTFYATQDEMEQRYASMPKSAAKVQLLGELRPWRKAVKAMSDLSSTKRDILADMKMDSAEKRTKIDAIELQMTNVARRVLGMPAIGK